MLLCSVFERGCDVVHNARSSDPDEEHVSGE
jgi:hypothetical protein